MKKSSIAMLAIGLLVVIVLGLLAITTDLFDWQLVPASVRSKD
jgi:hypothetical protein